MNFEIQELKVRKFVEHCNSENISSSRVMEKLGMSLASKTQWRRNKSSNEVISELGTGRCENDESNN